jgi:hypothetical protein
MKKRFTILLICAAAIFAGCSTPQPNTPLPPQAVVRQNRPVKMINGEPYVYVTGELGSNVPGRWVPQDSAAAQNLPSDTEAVDQGTLQKWQGGGYR